MLLSLHIENIAIIKSVDLDFSSGFMVLTGETGAGKSIIIDSINLLLGGRTEREMIRTGESSATVSGLFGDMSEYTLTKLSEVGISADDDGSLLVQRTVSADGRSRIYINGRSVTLAILKSIAPYLVSVHGQSDTSYLTDSKNHIELLDVYAGCDSVLSEYSVAYSALEDIRRDISDIESKALESERLKEMLEYQIKDIDSAGLRDGEEEELVDRKVKIKNSEKITKNSEFAYKALKGSEKGGVCYLIDRSISALSQISDVVPEFADYSERLREVLYQVDDIAEEVYAVLEDGEADPDASLNEIEARLDKISRLKRKYGLTVKDILAFRDKAVDALDRLQNSDSLLKSLRAKEKAAYTAALALADRLHAMRCAVIPTLEESVKDTLGFLDMPSVVFFVSQKERTAGGEKQLYHYGYDDVEFYISANKGADAQPLSKIASGGEMARIMLALKSVIADKDGVPTVIYDEIDAGVSGKTARKIGIKMLSLSKTSQLFCVTHSAQIASLADTHFLISKSDIDGVTETGVRILDYDGRITELSRILGGIDVTKSQRDAARDMLEEKTQY